MSFRGNALNPSCDAPGCHARAESPSADGKDFCSRHRGSALPSETEFFAVLRERLRLGRAVYGDRSFSREPSELLGELEQEALDLAGWGYVLWCRVQRARAAATEAGL